MLRAWASMVLVSTAVATTSSIETGTGLVERVVALEAGQLDDLLHQPDQPLALGEHPAGEPLDGLGIVGGVLHGLGQQPDRADRRLELVADVGDEVTADRLDPALAGAVLDQGQHQPAAERRDPRGHVPRRGARRTRDHQLGLADLAVAAYLPDQLGQLGVDHLVVAHEAEGVRRRGGLEDPVLLVDHHRARAEHGEHRRHLGGYDGCVGGRYPGVLPLADVPGQQHATDQHGSEQGEQQRLRRRHALIVRRLSR